MQPTDPEQRNRGPGLPVVGRQACPLSSLSETSGLSVNVRWSAERGPEQSGSGTVTRSESSENRVRRGREALEGHAPERGDAKRGGRVRRRRLTRKVGGEGRRLERCVRVDEVKFSQFVNSVFVLGRESS